METPLIARLFPDPGLISSCDKRTRGRHSHSQACAGIFAF
jgi:hypothetical protein